MGDYRKLNVWHKTVALEARLRRLVDELPHDERRRIGDQIIRAVESIRLNIVEGAGLNTDPQFARHLLLSLGSANEVQDAIDILNGAGHLPERDLDLITLTAEIRRMLASLHNRVAPKKRRPKNEAPPNEVDSDAADD